MPRPSNRTLSVGLVTLRKKGKYWYARYPAPGSHSDGREERSLKVTQQRVAIDKARQIDSLLQEGRSAGLAERRRGSQLTFGEYVVEFLETYDRWADTTRRSDQSRVKFIIEEFGHSPLDAITPRMVESWLARLRDERRNKPSTRNRYLSVLKTMFKMAHRWGYLGTNPLLLVRMAPAQSIIPAALTEEEVDKLLSELPLHNQRIVRVAVDTGMRLSELQRLEWGDVDFGAGYLRVRHTKNGEFRVIPMTTCVRQMLQTMRDELDGQRVHDLPVLTFTDARYSIEKAAKRADVGHVHFHMFRHTFATRLRDRGVPLDRIKELLGHKTMVMTLRYAKVRPVQLKEAIAALD